MVELAGNSSELVTKLWESMPRTIPCAGTFEDSCFTIAARLIGKVDELQPDLEVCKLHLELGQSAAPRAQGIQSELFRKTLPSAGVSLF